VAINEWNYFWKQILVASFLCKNVSKFQKSCNFPYAGSDHELCYVVFKSNNCHFSSKTIVTWNLSDVDWVTVEKRVLEFSHSIGELRDASFSANPIDHHFWRLNNYVLNILDEYVPLKKRRITGKINPWFYRKNRNKLYKALRNCDRSVKNVLEKN